MPTINRYWKPKRHNKTYRGSLTKYNKKIRDRRILAFMAIWFISIAIQAVASSSHSFNISPDFVEEKSKARPVVEQESVAVINPVIVALPAKVETMYREVTAYNAGDPYQCDNTPCISASGDNICQLLAQGQIIFASNEFPLGTKLYVEGIGEGIVLDRMNSRFKTRIDYAMQAHEKPRAIAFGLQVLFVKIKK